MRPFAGALGVALAVFSVSAAPAAPPKPARPAPAVAAADAEAFRRAGENGAKVEEVFRRTRRMLHAWLAHADERTLLLPDVLPGHVRGPKGDGIYRPHNSGADNSSSSSNPRPLRAAASRSSL